MTPLDQTLRNALRNGVQACREILTKDLTETLEATYGIHRDGRFEPLSAVPEVQADARARETRELLERLLPAAPTSRGARADFEAAFDALLRSLAFTHMNRLVAFKTLEDPSRKVLKETVGQGLKSRGFLFYLADHSEDEELWKTGRGEAAYRHFLLSQCGELNREIGVLFEPDDLASRIFPRPKALDSVLARINATELVQVWAHEETTGWVYQYWTPKELREQARKEHHAPRNSYDLAFRNQFYTPDYVVRFLVDNTLGRIWLEMKSDTALREQCRLLAIRPDEPIARRPKKDPREIRIMDPACGSGHFLLYAFDLLDTIYREAYGDPDLGSALKRTYDDPTAFERAIPALIVEHNLHGIDIDKRAVQLTQLTLFLKAKSRNKDARLELSHIVCAEPMPGERDLFEDFKQRELPTLKEGQSVVARLLDGIREHLALAAEAGSLLQAERELARLVAQEHAAWRAQRSPGTQDVLFAELRKPEQQGLDFADVTDDQFWNGVESSVERLLHEYANEAAGAEGAHRKIFARNGVEVLRFLDVLRRRYDVVLMNPPYGEPTPAIRSLLEADLKECGADIGCLFVRDAVERLAPAGSVGVLLSTASWFKPSFARWRQSYLLSPSRSVRVGAHLGGKVLDEATVSASAFTVAARTVREAAVFFRHIRDAEKDRELQQAISLYRRGDASPKAFLVTPEDLSRYRNAPLAYWTSQDLRNALADLSRLEGKGAEVRQGLASADDFRFIRSWWEVPLQSRGIGRRWLPLTKSSEFSPYWDDITWVLDWQDLGVTIRASGRARPQNIRYFGQAGVTYPARSVLGFNPRVHPRGCAFGHMGSVAFPLEGTDPATLLGYLSSRPLQYVLSFSVGSLQGEKGTHPNHYEVGLIQDLPWPLFTANQRELLATASRAAAVACKGLQASDETTHQYRGWELWRHVETISSSARERVQRQVLLVRTAEDATARLDRIVSEALGFRRADHDDMEAEFAACERISTGPWSLGYETRRQEHHRAEAAALLSLALGTALGRFDVRLARTPQQPELPDPFSPIPQYPAGILRDDEDPAGYPIRIAEDGILVDDEGHECDIVARVREVLHFVFRDHADAIEHEAYQILGVGSLREYFTRPGAKGFCDDHVNRYSKGRRRAPVYWLLRSPRGLYSVLVYYHRLDRDTLHRLLGPKYLGSKMQRARQAIEELRPGGRTKLGITKKEERRLAGLDDLLVELEEFGAKIQTVITRVNQRGETVGYDPNLDDGVVLNAAPLHELISWPRKKKHRGRSMSELTAYWEELAEGKYDWAHIAMRYWPTRVTENCRSDRSLALAHGLDAQFFPGLRDELRRQADTASAAEPGDEELVADESEEEDE